MAHDGRGRGTERRARRGGETIRNRALESVLRRAAGGFAVAAGLGVAAAGVPAWAQHGAVPVEAGRAAGEGARAPSIMNVEPGLMVWTVVTFVVLLAVLRRTAWKPLLASLDAREKRIREAVEGAERARRDSEELLERHHRMLEDAKEEAHKIIEEGKSDGLKLRQDIMTQARAEAEESMTRARREIELATDQAKKDLWVEASRLSTDLAERILGRSLDDADHQRIIDRVVEEYRASDKR